ncbi:MAG: tetratricopeptide repeat protein [Bacteroidetes bacterium]|nr:tetratricopeptide repeat protein [Bacteroidota bacterium]
MKKEKILFAGLVIALLCGVIFAYYNHFNNPFHFDDEHTIVSNVYIRDLKNIPLFFTDARTFSSLPANQSYRPGVTTLNAIDCWLGGKGVPVPFYFHVSIFISFLLTGLFMYLLAVKIFRTALPNSSNPFVALLAVAVFLLHTANAETINYIISRSDVDSTLLILVALCVFAYYPALRKFQLYLIPMFLGFLIKEPAVMVAPLIFIYVFLFEKQYNLLKVFNLKASWNILWMILPVFLLGIGMYLIRETMIPSTYTQGGYDRWGYLTTQAFVMVHYVNNFFFPFNLSADTDWGLIKNVFDPRVTIGLAFIFFTIYLAYKASLQAKSRPITFGILWFYIALLPTSSFFPFSEVLNDHRVFFPYIGLTMAVVWALFLLYKKYESAISKSIIIQGGILLFFIAFFSAHIYGVRERVKIWSSGESLWYDVTIKSPRNGRGLMNYGNVLMGKGDYKGAEEYFNKAKQEWPYYSYIYVNLGVLNSANGKYEEAEKDFKYALQLNNQNPNCYYYYGNMLKNSGRIQEAKAMIQQGLNLSPQQPDLNRLMAEITGNPVYQGQIKNKIELLEKLSQQQPTPENYINLSLEYYYQARYLDCVHAADEAIKLKPNYDLAYNNICSAYNMLHEWDKAIEAGQKAVELNPNSQLAKNNLKVSMDGKKNQQ